MTLWRGQRHININILKLQVIFTAQCEHNDSHRDSNRIKTIHCFITTKMPKITLFLYKTLRMKYSKIGPATVCCSAFFNFTHIFQDYIIYDTTAPVTMKRTWEIRVNDLLETNKTDYDFMGFSSDAKMDPDQSCLLLNHDYIRTVAIFRAISSALWRICGVWSPLTNMD